LHASISLCFRTGSNSGPICSAAHNCNPPGARLSANAFRHAYLLRAGFHRSQSLQLQKIRKSRVVDAGRLILLNARSFRVNILAGPPASESLLLRYRSPEHVQAQTQASGLS